MIELKHGQVLILNQQQCKQLIREEEVPQLMEDVLRDFSNGEVINPLKTHVPFYSQYNSYLNAMPCWLKNRNVAGIKWAGSGEDNPRTIGFPQSVATLILNDPETALPLAFMDSTYIMALRTGAVAAVMAKYCCKKGTKVMTIIGAGVQGTSAFRMTMLTMPQIEEVRVVDINPAAIERFIDQGTTQYPNVKFVPCEDLQSSVRGADLIIPAAHSAGSSGSGILDDIELDKGTTIVGISGGLSLAKVRQRCDRSILDYIKCFVYRINATRGYMKELYGIDVEEVDESVADCEIGDVIAGKAPGRVNDEEIVHAAGVGMGIEDVIVADVIYRRALEQDIGLVVDVIN